MPNTFKCLQGITAVAGTSVKAETVLV